MCRVNECNYRLASLRVLYQTAQPARPAPRLYTFGQYYRVGSLLLQQSTMMFVQWFPRFDVAYPIAFDGVKGRNTAPPQVSMVYLIMTHVHKDRLKGNIIFHAIGIEKRRNPQQHRKVH